MSLTRQQQSSSGRQTPWFVVHGLLAAVFACIVVVLIYAVHTGRRPLTADGLQREAAVQIAQGAGSAGKTIAIPIGK